MQGELVHAGVLNQKMDADAQGQYLSAILGHLYSTCFSDHALAGTPVSQDEWNAALAGKFDVHAFAAGLKEHMRRLTFSGFDFDVAGAVTKGIDDLLAALERRDAEQI